MKRTSQTPMPWLLALGALLTASFLLAYYVNLLQDAVARGSQLKYTQQDAPTAAHKLATAHSNAS
ncbi:MAG: hypothetical protein M3O01_12745 [Pseudomonadota bacterium]|nr:hypothetical protein [Pseudomonadota bacterium]